MSSAYRFTHGWVIIQFMEFANVIIMENPHLSKLPAQTFRNTIHDKAALRNTEVHF